VTKRSSKEKIGAAFPRLDAVDKVRGDARFVDDLAFPGMVYAKVIRSSVPHARIRRVDLTRVNPHPHVVSTVTAEDIPGENVVHVIYDDQPALADGVVRYVGEPIALVAAKTHRAAAAAEKLAKIDYEEIPAVTDSVEALKPDAPVVAVPEAVEEAPNLFNAMRLRKGDTEHGFAEAEVIVEGTYHTGYQEHAYLETQGIIAMPEENGAFAIYGSMQCPFYVQNAVAKVLGVPLAKVRVVQTATGGAFGGKEDVPSQIACLAALLAWKCRQPVKLVLTREEDILTTSKRHPSIVHYRSGAKADGTLTANALFGRALARSDHRGRSLSYSKRQSAWTVRCHKYGSMRRVSRIRKPAGDLPTRVTDGSVSGAPGHRSVGDPTPKRVARRRRVRHRAVSDGERGGA